MRTAEEILLDVYNPSPNDDSPTWREDLQLAITLNPSLELIEKAINEARIECIKECADSKFITYSAHQSILKKINQVI